MGTGAGAGIAGSFDDVGAAGGVLLHAPTNKALPTKMGQVRK